MLLDIYIKKMLNAKSSNGVSVQKLLDTLKILDEVTYNQILDDGICECFGEQFMINEHGKVVGLQN